MTTGIALTQEESGHAARTLAKVATSIEGMDVQTLATVLVRSGYFADTQGVAQAVVKVLAGREIGFGPIASMQGVYLVKGRVTWAANLIAAAIQRSGRFRYRVDKLDKAGCRMTFFERDAGKWEPIGISEFGPEDAAQAGLNKGDNWQHYPRNMYFARALTNGARWYCPEVFNGPVYTPDELGARVDDEGQVIDIPAAPPIETAEPFVPTRECDVEDRAGECSPNPPASEGRPDDHPPESSGRRPSRGELWKANRELGQKATELGIEARTVPQRAGDAEIAAENDRLRVEIREKEATLAEAEAEF